MNPIKLNKLREGGAECPSDLALDKWSSEALSALEQKNITAHISDCATCGERARTRRQGLEAFPALDEARQVTQIQRRLSDSGEVVAQLESLRQSLQRNPVE